MCILESMTFGDKDHSNTSENWTLRGTWWYWRLFERFKFFLAVSKVEEAQRVPHLLNSLGTKICAVLKNLVVPQKPSECTLAQITELLIRHFKPKPPVIAEHFAFHKRDQHPGEPIKEFLIELQWLAHTCNFGNFLEQALRDHLVCGMTNSSTQKKLLAK